MLEEGPHIILALMATEELKTLRNRMLDFIVDFETLFVELLSDWRGDTRVFVPTR
ncbi:MAG: hypothetical protein ACFFBD_09430 [Candidatus Hodarchaeota archaeon]